jgi:hypothetical protein
LSEAFTPLHTGSVEDTLRRIHEIGLTSSSILESVVVGDELHHFPHRLPGKIDGEEFARYLDGRIGEELRLDKYISRGGISDLIGGVRFPKYSEHAGILLGLYRVFGEPEKENMF